MSESYSKHKLINNFPLQLSQAQLLTGLTRLFLNFFLPRLTILGPVQDLRLSWQKEVEQKLRPELLTFYNLNSCPLELKVLSIFFSCTCLPAKFPAKCCILKDKRSRSFKSAYNYIIIISTSDGFSFNAATTAGFLATWLCGGLDQDKGAGGWLVGWWWSPDVL